MKERPILFSAPMMNANMAGWKTMTRRTTGLDEINENPDCWFYNGTSIQGTELYAQFSHMLNGKVVDIRCAYGKPGDILWARETYCVAYDDRFYKADGEPKFHDGTPYPKSLLGKWRPSIHMPRQACRFTAVNKDVRIERLQKITRGDSMEEGCPFPNIAKETDPQQWFRSIWVSINGEASWNHNPYVWVISYDNPNVVRRG